MAHDMVHSTPRAPAATESAVQYMHLANIGIALAMYLSKLGYSARAHIDGNYQVLATAVAFSLRVSTHAWNASGSTTSTTIGM